MDVTIHARLLRLNKEGLLQAVRHVACNGQVSYRIVNFLGDGTIRREAIARYLAADIEASHDRDIALTASHYEFRLIATPALAPDGRQMRGFRIKPKQKRAGLFKGEVWFDEETGMAVRELGQFVKNPSVYLRKLSFVRDYEIRDGISVPHRIQSTIETRIAGRLELTVLFSNFAYSDAGDRNCQDGNAGQWRLAAKRETGR